MDKENENVVNNETEEKEVQEENVKVEEVTETTTEENSTKEAEEVENQAETTEEEKVEEVEKEKDVEAVSETEEETKSEEKTEEKKEDKKEAKEAKKADADKVEKKKEEKKEIKALEKKVKKVNSEKIVMASIIIGILVIAFGLFGFYFYNTNLKPVVRFEGGSVTTSDFNVYYKTFAPMLQYYGYPADEIPKQIAQKAGIDMIILKRAKDAGVTLSAEDKAKVDEIFNDESQVEQFVNEGIDVAKMKQLYYNDYTITAYLEKLADEAKDEDVIKYIKENSGEDADLYGYDTSHILFKTTDDSTGSELSEDKVAEVKAKAEAALKRALAGEDFAALAKELSEDTGTKENGGQYTMYMDGNTYTEYSDAVKNLKEGEITAALVKSEAGYHIIKLNKKIENGRAKNKTEREEFVDEDINKLSEELDVDETYLKKLVAKISGTSAEESDTETNVDTTTDGETTEDTQSTDATTTDSTDATQTTTTEQNAQ